MKKQAAQAANGISTGSPFGKLYEQPFFFLLIISSYRTFPLNNKFKFTGVLLRARLVNHYLPVLRQVLTHTKYHHFLKL